MILGFVGSGNMAQAMARGWATAAGEGPAEMLFSDTGSGRASTVAEEVGGSALGSPRELVEASDALVLAFPPSRIGEVAPSLTGSPLILSLLGATPLETLSGHFPDSQVIRLMPNLAVETNDGVVCMSVDADQEAKAKVLPLLESLGMVVELEDSVMDAATAVMGCSPAYFAKIADALAGVGVEEGLDPDVCLAMVAQSLAGTASLLGRRTPFEISVAVAHPGGSTEAGLEALAEAGGEAAFRAAAEASLTRMRQQG
jgi:pyrroline-5-carboxylate reductase